MPPRAPRWTSPPRSPQGSPLAVWRLCLDALPTALDAALRPWTTPAERERARRYRATSDRHRHLAGRALARLLLARRLGCPPSAVAFTEGPHGKPHLEAPATGGSSLHFNIAHTGTTVVVAVSQDEPVGVDVEALGRNVDTDALAGRVLTAAEQAQWRGLPAAERRAALLHLWTCKEAFVKATGQGLRRGAHTVACDLDGGTATALTDAEGHVAASPRTTAEAWALCPFALPTSLVGAVVRWGTLPRPVAWHTAAPLVRRQLQA